MLIREIQLRAYPYKKKQGLSERLIRNYFTKKGYEVFRGQSALGKEFSVYYELYYNVRRKVDRMEAILSEKLGGALPEFRELMTKTKGIPDYFVYKKGECMFVEVKLENESIKKHQLFAMGLIEDFGIDVMVMRVKSKVYRLKSKIVNGRVKVVERQKRLGKSIKKSKKDKTQ